MIPKRVFWLTVGAVAGAGASVRAQRAVKRKVAPYTPEHLPGTIAGGVRSIGDGVRGAVHEGRDAMREHEARLRADLPTGPRRRSPAAGTLRAVPSNGDTPVSGGGASTASN
jgi:hypothetical protein